MFDTNGHKQVKLNRTSRDVLKHLKKVRPVKNIDPGPQSVNYDMACTAIVCAYNEEASLSGVLDALLATTQVDEIIVIDDGSIDSTAELIRGFAGREKIRAIFLAENRGKGYAMSEGVINASNELLLFVDADLLNWNPDYAFEVIWPIVDGKADMVIGYPISHDSLFDPWDLFRITRWISGERAVWRKDMIPLLDAMRSSRYGVETLINLSYRKASRRVQCNRLNGLIHPVKVEKKNLSAALQDYRGEARDIIMTVSQRPDLAFAAIGLDSAKIHARWRTVNNRLRRTSIHYTLQSLKRIGQIIYEWQKTVEGWNQEYV